MIFTIILALIVALLVAVIVVLLARLVKSEKSCARAEQSLSHANSELEVVKSQHAGELARNLESSAKELARVQEQHKSEIERMRAQHEAELERMRRQEEQRQKLAEDRFKTLATDILDDNSRKLRQQNEERLDEILRPLKENITSFRETFDRTYTQESRERFSLSERIKELVEVNNTLGKEARELATALRSGTQTQGQWGEMVLETILSKSGLEKGKHFVVQETKDAQGNTLQDENGRAMRADVVVYYPDGRCIVIDSKVSLNAYVDMINATDPAQAEALAKKHAADVRENMRILANKNYSDYIGEKKADFVMMFIPNEGAYLAAMNADQNLWQEAYDKRIVIISPTHLISALRLIGQLWRNDDMTKNVMNIAEEGGKMYDKLVGFVEDLLAIEKALKQADSAYDKAMKKLKTGTGSLVGRAEKMRKLGAKAAKSLPKAVDPEEEILEREE